MIGFVRYIAILAVVCIILTAGITSYSPGQPTMLPSAAGGWTRVDSVGVYAGKSLFLLIDGGADLFYEYGFVRAFSSDYSRSSDTSATVELYEMESPVAAYGLFTSFTAGTGKPVPLGQEAVLGEGYCIFWKAQYVGMLTVASGDSTAGQTLLRLAGEMEKGIHHTGALPGLCTLLREGGVELRTTVFVRGKLARRNHFHHAWADHLPTVDGVVGESGASRYLILECRDAAAAAAALRAATVEWKKLQLSVARDAGGHWAIEQRDGGVATVEQQGRYILAVSGAREKSKDVAAHLRRILGG